jgi:soluble lytic murein transglycosylase-like protein
MKIQVRLLVLILVLILVPVEAAAGVKIKVLEDGSQVMYNDRPAKRTWTPQPRPTSVPRSEIDGFIEAHARRQQLDPDLVRAVIQVESAFQPWAESNKGAMGLMQLMPETARVLSVEDPWDPNENLRGGTIYLRHLLDRFGGQLELALAGYNAGPENVDRYGGIPPFDETVAYVEKVLRVYRNEPDLSIGHTNSYRGGRKTFLTRDKDGKYVLTTTKVANR